MAKLSCSETGAEITLVARHIVGRSRVCALRIDADTISGVHAEFVWDADAWQLHDLGSRNGTFIDGRRLDPGHFVTLTVGAVINFGRTKLSHRVIDLELPQLTAIAEDSEVVIARDDLLALPSAERCVVTVMRNADQDWVLETDTQTRVIADQEQIEIDGRRWRIYPPGSFSRTHERSEAPSFAELTLEFRVSRDREHVDVALVHSGGRVPLKTRAHAFLLLSLARTRLADAGQPHLVASERGWHYCGELMGEFDVGSSQLNLWVFRARKQLAQLGIEGASGLIERRYGAQQLRIGIARLHIQDT